MKNAVTTALILASALAASAQAGERLPTIPPAQYTPEQKKAAEDFVAARQLPVFGPFQPLMHSPQVMSLARAMGDYLRYHSAIGNTLSEFVILVTARECSQDYEWHVHRQDGQKLVRFPDQAVAQKQHGRTVGVPA